MIAPVFIGAILALIALAFAIYRKSEASTIVIKDESFEKLQKHFFIAYFLATFADWLHGPYVYKLYSDYGCDEDTIAVLYIIGFASSSISGAVIGHVADKYGRKYLCASFGILYSISALTKISSNLNLLFLGRVLGGASTSILFSAFESWYVNEHLNFHKLPPEWLHVTFSKAAFFNGLLAIIAGILAQFVAEILNFGSVAPFIVAIPFLLSSTYFICMKWEEHSNKTEKESDAIVFSSLKLMFCEERILLLLGFIQTSYESVMYIFVFSWTPVLSQLNPPLGLVFSIFMVAIMIGSKLYELLINSRYRPENILMITCVLGLFCFSTVSILISSTHMEREDTKLQIFVCFLCFILYEMSIGIYFPAMSYLRGRLIAEKYRASVANWFRFPMNILTCIGLLLKYEARHSNDKSHVSFNSSKFSIIFHVCSIFLLFTACTSAVFSRKYSLRMEDERRGMEIENKKVSNTNKTINEKVNKT